MYFTFPLHHYKVTADLQLYIWVLYFMGFNSIDSDFSLELSDTYPLLQVGGLKLVVHLTWMAYITQPHPVWFATMVLSGTTGRVQIWWLLWQLWWCALQTSDDMTHVWREITKWMSAPINIMNNNQEILDNLEGCFCKCLGICIYSQMCPDYILMAIAQLREEERRTGQVKLQYAFIQNKMHFS